MVHDAQSPAAAFGVDLQAGSKPAMALTLRQRPLVAHGLMVCGQLWGTFTCSRLHQLCHSVSVYSLTPALRA